MPKLFSLKLGLYSVAQFLYYNYSVANNGRSSAIADCLRTVVGKKNLEITHTHTHTHTHTQKYFKTAKPERSFFSNYIIQFHLNFF